MKQLAVAFAACLSLAASSAQAAPPRPTKPMPRSSKRQKEGKVVWYTSTDVQVSESSQKDFEAKYPGIDVQVERAGAERIYQRINRSTGQDLQRRRDRDVGCRHFLVFKRDGLLTQAVPADVAKFWHAEAKDPDGHYAAYRAHLSVIGYNTKQVKPKTLPKAMRPAAAEMAQPHRQGPSRLQRHRADGTAALSKLLGWEYFEKLGKQRIMQVQSSTEPPKKLAQGERSVMAVGNEYNLFLLRGPACRSRSSMTRRASPIAIGPCRSAQERTSR